MFRGRRGDRAKVHERALKLAARGDLDRAAAVLEAHLAANPDDDRTLIKLADLRRKAGDDAAAVAALLGATRLYRASGFLLKAAAALRQAVGLAPGDLALVEELANLNTELGLAREAARGLEVVAAAAASAGDAERHLAVRRRIHALLPADAGAALRLADVLAALGRRDEAVELLEAAARPEPDEGRLEVWLLLQERLCALLPADLRRARRLAFTLLDRGSPRRALGLLRPCYCADPSDVETLVLLARAFEALGQRSRAGAAWRELARAHGRAGRAAELRAAWQRVLAFIPGDPEATTALTPPPLPPRSPAASLADELAEADFLASHGAPDEARAVLMRLRDLFPGSAEVAARLEGLDVVVLRPGELVADEEPVVEEEGRDSTTAILDRVPAERLPRVAEGAMHRDLAVAFLEMERFDEALAELERALAADPLREGACLSLAGRCHLARGAPRDAVDAYRRALASTTLTFEAASAVHYELADALESLGEERAALSHFREAAKLEPGFRSVERRILALGG